MSVVRKDAFTFFFSPTCAAMVAEPTPQESAIVAAGLFAGTLSPFRIVMLP